MSDVNRSEHEDLKQRVARLEDGQTEMVGLLHKIDTQTQLTYQQVQASKDGLEEIEGWAQSRPPVCLLAQHVSDTLATPVNRRVNAWNVAFGLFGICGMVVTGLIALLKP